MAAKRPRRQRATPTEMSAQDYLWLGETPLQWRTFLDTPPSEADPDGSRVFVIPVPYDSTTSYKTGARHGPAAIIDASRHLEDYDIELDRDITEVGIHTTPEVQPNMDGPKAMVETVSAAVKSAASRGKLTAILGGEHTVTVGAVQAYSDLYEDLSVLYIDAHADLRESYQGTRWGHASVARRIYDICPLVLVGIRSISADEMNFLRGQGIPTQFWSAQATDNIRAAIALATEHLSENVYISIDLDVLDPSIMSAVGTPEPGGMLWHEILALLRAVSREANIIGFDIVELCPPEGPAACAFTAAKLAYKLVGYATQND